jgi:hypothetical protein
MTFQTVADIVDSLSLLRRELAGIAKEGIDPPDNWQFQHRWKLAAQPGWDAAWDSALASHPDDPDYDPGADQSVITDGMILSAIQLLVEEDTPVQLPPQLVALEPASASITDADFEGHVRGTGFTEDTVIIWNGAEEPTRFVDETDVWTMVIPSVVTAPTILDVYVRNADGQVSSILPFTWTA